MIWIFFYFKLILINVAFYFALEVHGVIFWHGQFDFFALSLICICLKIWKKIAQINYDIKILFCLKISKKVNIFVESTTVHTKWWNFFHQSFFNIPHICVSMQGTRCSLCKHTNYPLKIWALFWDKSVL
jgi:hypothetical protein